ncbi:MAG: ribosomal RNA small subunit methyltransferase A [Oligoflexia bacterium]|nr:ribosomal RNA small subunit methyltransferase A [Oligoflexia bacterium]
MKDIPATAAAVLRQWSGGARKRFGQHFLVSDGIIDRIVAAAEISPGDSVLEIGPGPGVLTAALLRAGAVVTAIELDRDCATHVAGLFPQARVVQGDATTLSLADLGVGPGWRCVSNLPYNVGTRILLRLLDQAAPLSRLVLMLQREVAERILAPPGDRKRGSLSVAVQARAQVSRVCRVSPGAFRPPPRVDSAVLLILPRPPAQVPPGLDELLRLSFASPRKTLRNNLRPAWAEDTVPRLLQAGVDPGLRPAMVDLDAWRRLAASWCSTLANRSG